MKLRPSRHGQEDAFRQSQGLGRIPVFKPRQGQHDHRLQGKSDDEASKYWQPTRKPRDKTDDRGCDENFEDEQHRVEPPRTRHRPKGIGLATVPASSGLTDAFHCAPAQKPRLSGELFVTVAVSMLKFLRRCGFIEGDRFSCRVMAHG